SDHERIAVECPARVRDGLHPWRRACGGTRTGHGALVGEPPSGRVGPLARRAAAPWLGRARSAHLHAARRGAGSRHDGRPARDRAGGGGAARGPPDARRDLVHLAIVCDSLAVATAAGAGEGASEDRTVGAGGAAPGCAGRWPHRSGDPHGPGAVAATARRSADGRRAVSGAEPGVVADVRTSIPTGAAGRLAPAARP